MMTAKAKVAKGHVRPLLDTGRKPTFREVLDLLGAATPRGEDEWRQAGRDREKVDRR